MEHALTDNILAALCSFCVQQKRIRLVYEMSVLMAPSLLSHLDTFLPIQRATMGVKATVGGNRMGDAALWTA